MCKKIFCTIIILILMFVFTIPAMAYPEIDGPIVGNATNSTITENSSVDAKDVEEEEEDLFEKLLAEIIKNPNIKETEHCLATVGKRDNPLIFSGTLIDDAENEEEKSEDKDVWIMIAIYNKEKNIYEEYVDASGVTRWKIGEAGTFSNQIQFDKSEKYKLKLIIYVKPLIELSKDDLINNLDYLRENWYNNISNFEAEDNDETRNGETRNNYKYARIILEPGKNLQINYFDVEVKDKEKIDQLLNKPADLSPNSIINKILPSK